MAADMNTAMQHMQAGNFKAASKVLRQIVSREPHNLEAAHTMGIALARLGKFVQAERTIARAVKANPKLAFGHNNLGEIYRNQNKLKQAEASFRKAIEIDSDFADAHHNLGVTLQASGQHEAAVESFNTALNLQPDDRQTMNLLAGLLGDLGRFDEAEQVLRSAIQHAPDQAGLYINLSTILRQQQDRKLAALVAGRKAVSLAPNLAVAHFNLGVCLTHIGNFPAALEAHDRAIELDSDNEQFHEKRSQTLVELGRADEIVERLEDRAREFPQDHDHQFALAQAYRSLGRRDDTIALVRKTIELDPNHVAAHCELVNADAAAVTDTEIERMLGLLDDPARSDLEKADLGFALGKLFEKRGDFDRAFEFIDQANQRTRGTRTYSVDTDRASFEKLKHVFDAKFFESAPSGVCDSTLPIFIVGMPRSGSTLVEQILASHPQVYAAGEISTLGMSAFEETDENGKMLYPDRATELDAAAYERITHRYIENLKAHPLEHVSRVVDKALENYFQVGLIRTLFKQPRIIHVVRNPMDTCWSIFGLRFNTGHSYGYDLSELGAYYRMYLDLMDHWKTVLPGVMLDVKYEELVEDQEGHTRKILDYCGLPFDDRCLDFSNTKRAVNTASVWQVRQPLYRTSVERWRPFEKHLEPLMAALKGD